MAKESVMTFDKYIDNPSGEATVVTNRNMYKKMYQDKFDAVLVREQGKVEYTVYRTNDAKDTYFIYMKIPSEVVEKFYYDVVIRLYTSDNAMKSAANLRNYNVQFFSNDPAFVYTFAHAFEKNHLFIDDLKSKMTKEALTTAAKTKNPKDNVWYVKSLYFAYLTMEKYNLFKRTALNQNAIKYSQRTLLSQITPAATKIKARQDEYEKQEKAKKVAKAKEAKEKAAKASTSTPLKNITKTAKVATTSKTTKATSTVKTTRSTKKV